MGIYDYTVKDAKGNDGARLPIQTHTTTDGNNRNTNSAVLTYGNKSHTTWARAEISSYQFDVAKAAATDDETKFSLLDGAKFALYRELGAAEEGATAYTANVSGTDKTYYYRADGALRFSRDGSTYTYLEDDATGSDSSKGNTTTRESGSMANDGAASSKGDSTTSLAASSHGAINIRGIEAGTYVLVEQEAPEGYSKLDVPLVVTVHDRAYKNTDMVEDNNPGSRHSNVEGDITITGPSTRGILARDVYTWHATCDGEPATYVRARAWVESPAAVETEPAIVVEPEAESPTKKEEKPAANGGVLVINAAAATTSGGVGTLGIAALLVAVVGAAIFFVRGGFGKRA